MPFTSSTPAPIYATFLLSVPASKGLSEERKEGEGWVEFFLWLRVCPPLLLGVCHHRFKFPFKFLHTVGVQKYGLLVNAALCAGTGIF